MVNINNSNNFSITKNFEHNKFVSALQTSMARLGLQASCTKKSTSFELMGKGEGAVWFILIGKPLGAITTNSSNISGWSIIVNRVRYNYEYSVLLILYVQNKS